MLMQIYGYIQMLIINHICNNKFKNMHLSSDSCHTLLSNASICHLKATLKLKNGISTSKGLINFHLLEMYNYIFSGNEINWKKCNATSSIPFLVNFMKHPVKKAVIYNFIILCQPKPSRNIS